MNKEKNENRRARRAQQQRQQRGGIMCARKRRRGNGDVNGFMFGNHSFLPRGRGLGKHGKTFGWMSRHRHTYTGMPKGRRTNRRTYGPALRNTGGRVRRETSRQRVTEGSRRNLESQTFYRETNRRRASERQTIEERKRKI